MLDELTRLKMLEKPSHIVDAVLDTDAFNEIDDQFAIAYMVKSTEKINVKAMYAAPFFNGKVQSVKEGMEKSYDELSRVLKLAGAADIPTFRGSDEYLPDEKTPVESDAARHLCALADDYTSKNPLYVVAIGAITNIASALLIKPEIADRIVIVWLGGNAHHWGNNYEFNMAQDVAAARVVFGSGAPLVQLPCMGVVSAFAISPDELKTWFAGKNELCDFLAKRTIGHMAERYDMTVAWSKVIWDVTAVGWIVGDFEESRIIHTPVPQYDLHFSVDESRPFMRYVYYIKRDLQMRDLIAKLNK